MTNINLSHFVQPGDLVLLVGNDHKEFIILMEPGQVIQTHRGVLPHDTVIGTPWGETVKTHIGYGYIVLPPSLEQLIRSVRRATQIIYPKEIGYLLMKMNIGPGTRIIEAGTGSGGLTLALGRMVQPDGHVYTYEARSDIQNLAQKNIAQVGLDRYVTFKLRDIAEGFDERDVDAVFLDVREPWEYLAQAHAALKGGGSSARSSPPPTRSARCCVAWSRHLSALWRWKNSSCAPTKPFPIACGLSTGSSRTPAT
jgi:tRNA (adenine57-N1/adenine58-N1)-methyltransferase